MYARSIYGWEIQMHQYLVVLDSPFGKHRIMVLASNSEIAVCKATCTLMAVLTRPSIPGDFIDMTGDEANDHINRTGVRFETANYIG